MITYSFIRKDGIENTKIKKNLVLIITNHWTLHACILSRLVMYAVAIKFATGWRLFAVAFASHRVCW